MCDTVFAFSQRGGYHFESPSKWIRAKLPARLEALFAGEIRSVYCLAFGAAETFFISYKGSDEKVHIEHSGLPTSLSTWLFEKKDDVAIRSFTSIRVTLGPYANSYFATDGTSSKWCGLPASLDSAIEGYRKPGGGWLDAPRLVGLGAHGDFLLITQANAADWNLSHYPSLKFMISSLSKETSGLSAVKNFSLHAYRLNCFILQSSNGTVVNDNLPQHASAAIETITTAVAEDTATQARRELEHAAAQQQALKATAEVAALRQRVNEINRINQLRQINQINQINQMNALTNMFTAFLIGNNNLSF